LYCIYDVITTDDAIIQHLPKIVWILIVVLLSDIGSLLWLGLGRPRAWARRAHDPARRAAHQTSHYSAAPESDEGQSGPNPIVRYREEQARLRLREEQLNRREVELRRRELGGS
jgi:hypothetical protein